MPPAVVAASAGKGLGFGLLLVAFSLGFRHGIDYDHIAAITDITSSQEERRSALLFGTLYALGHAFVVFAIGVAAVFAGKSLPPSFDDVMTRIVGATLIVLAVYVVYSLIRHGRDFRLRSRWMLIFEGVRRGARWVRERAARRSHGSAGSAPTVEESTDLDPVLWHHGHHGRPGHHHHERPDPTDPMMNYGRRTAFVIGMIHGVGGETPTQVLLFAAAAGARGLTGVIVLGTFLLGLFTSNSLMTVASAFGYMRASRHFGIYAAVAMLTALFSAVIGVLFLLGRATVLPALFGG
jgi:high-affinity nickel-transport protein